MFAECGVYCARYERGGAFDVIFHFFRSDHKIPQPLFDHNFAQAEFVAVAADRGGVFFREERSNVRIESTRGTPTATTGTPSTERSILALSPPTPLPGAMPAVVS